MAELTPIQVEAKRSLEAAAQMEEHRGSIVAQARFDEIDYRPILKRATNLDKKALVSLFTMKFMGEGGETHCAILQNLMKLWGDTRFAEVLASQPKEIRDLVVSSIDYSWVDPDWISYPKTLALSPASRTDRQTSTLESIAVPAYEIHVGTYGESWRAEVRFSNSQLPPVQLLWYGDESFPYQPVFSTSPDGRWFLLIQKTGSGDNVAWLYSVDDTGRVFSLQTSLDSMVWRFSDKVSTIPHSQLYHTGISDPKWTNRQTLAFTLSGSDSKKSGRGVTLDLEYDLTRNLISGR